MAGYWSVVVSRAWEDTWALVFGSPLPSLLVTAFVFGLALLFTRRRLGHEAMSGELRAAGVSAIATGAVFGLVFIAHVLVISPAMLHQSLNDQRTTAENAQKTADGRVENLSKQIQDLDAKLGSRIDQLQADNQMLRDKLDDARAERPLELNLPPGLQPIDPPKLEKVQASSERLPSSPHKDAPHGLRVTLQTTTTILTPWTVAIWLDRVIVHAACVAPSAALVRMSGVAEAFSADRRAFKYTESIVTFTPQVAVVCTFYTALPSRLVEYSYSTP